MCSPDWTRRRGSEVTRDSLLMKRSKSLDQMLSCLLLLRGNFLFVWLEGGEIMPSLVFMLMNPSAALWLRFKLSCRQCRGAEQQKVAGRNGGMGRGRKRGPM